jgi:hypothetical protein
MKIEIQLRNDSDNEVLVVVDERAVDWALASLTRVAALLRLAQTQAEAPSIDPGEPS